MSLGPKLASFLKQLRRDGTAPLVLFRVGQRAAKVLRLAPAVSLLRCVIVELVKPPKVLGGFHDLVVRRGEQSDVAALASMGGDEPALIRARLDRGDLVFLGLLKDEVVCYTWFHAGPTPFLEERTFLAPWALDDSTFWSYDANAKPEARASGVFVKVFQAGLREVFEKHAAQRVRGFIYDTNLPSLNVHKRMGFTIVGGLTVVALAGKKLLRWTPTGGATRQWLLPRDSDFAVPPQG